MRGIGQVAKFLAARAEVRLTRAFGSGTVRQGRCRRERGVEVTVREQQRRRTKHENGEGEMERYDMRIANTLSHACSCLYVTQGKSAKKMCVRHGVCVHTAVATTWVRNLESTKKIPRLRRSTSILVVYQFAFHRSSSVNASLCFFDLELVPL